MSLGRGCGRVLASTGKLCDRPGCPGDNHPYVPTPADTDAAAALAARSGRAAEERHPLDEHRGRIEEDLGDLARMFDDEGHGFYLVGGMVRDGALALPLDHDIDIATDAQPDRVKQMLDTWADSVWDQGARFGTVAARRGEADVEITTFRSETYRHDSRKPDVRFADDITTDLSRRDFTINAIAVAMPSWDVIDPFGGMHDLRRGVLRTPSEPVGLFEDDPLRMLRAARFVARFGFEADPEVTEAVIECRDRIGIVSSERIGAEIGKMLSLSECNNGIEYLRKTGVLDSFLEGIDEPGLSSGTNVDLVPSGNRAARWVALLGSNRNTQDVVRLMSRRLSVDHDVTAQVKKVMSAAERARALPSSPSQQDLRGFVASHDTEAQRDGLLVLEAWGEPLADEMSERLSMIERREGPALRSAPLNGHRVAELVGGPGPRVGEMLRMLREHQIHHGPISARKAARLIQQRA